MAEINLTELARKTRPEVEEVALSLGLANASTYANKPAVVDAIKRVNEGGEDAAAVDAELKTETAPGELSDSQNSPETTPAPVQTSDNNEDDDDVDNDDELNTAAAEQPKKARPLAKNKNQGHPTAFDNTGRPLYRA